MITVRLKGEIRGPNCYWVKVVVGSKEFVGEEIAEEIMGVLVG